MNSSAHPTVEVVLMSRNRLEYVEQAIESILNQTYPYISFQVSDNSDDNTVTNMLTEKYPSIRWVKRTPTLSMSEHWNAILSEVRHDFFMMFHDDDILSNDAVSNLIEAIQSMPNIGACAGNAKIIWGNVSSLDNFNTNIKENLSFETVEKFGKRYFDAVSGGVNPFPGYLYSKKHCGDLRFNNSEAGKHSDVTFLFKILKKGHHILWTPKTTMQYRIHSSNDSVGIDIIAIVKLVKLYKKLSNSSSLSPYAQEFLVKNYSQWLKQLKKSSRPLKPISKRIEIVSQSVTKYWLRHPIRLSLNLYTKIIRSLL